MNSWFMAGSDPQDYELGIDANAVRNGKNSGYLKAKGNHSPDGGSIPLSLSLEVMS